MACALIGEAGGRTTAIYTAHALLAALHIDLIEEMLAGGLTLDAIRQIQAGSARASVAR